MNESSPTLEDAIALALEAHRGQTDKGGAPYILHPLRMMLRVRSPTERMVAVLHDVVEDSDRTLEDLRRRGFPGSVVAAVDALTRRKGEGETYEAFVRRVARHPVARRVKIADLEDNLDLSRIAAPGDEDRARMERYQRALALLREAVEEGDEP
jgi:(p)ppGpp synthase/HD superfamily hydrolase